MNIEQICSIGSNCTSLFFMNMMKKRFKGPIDNIDLMSFPNIIHLFNGDFCNDIINENCTFDESIKPGADFKICHFNICNYHMVHNDFSEKHTKIELLKRLGNFYEYIQLAKKNDNSLWFCYSVSYDDIEFRNDEIECQKWVVLNMLPRCVKERLIIVNHVTPELKKEFTFFDYPIFNISRDILTNEDYELFNCMFDEFINKNKEYFNKQ